jgi:hypothetical protein
MTSGPGRALAGTPFPMACFLLQIPGQGRPGTHAARRGSMPLRKVLSTQKSQCCRRVSQDLVEGTGSAEGANSHNRSGCCTARLFSRLKRGARNRCASTEGATHGLMRKLSGTSTGGAAHRPTEPGGAVLDCILFWELHEDCHKKSHVHEPRRPRSGPGSSADSLPKQPGRVESASRPRSRPSVRLTSRRP